MDKEDARFQKLEQLHERRKQVVPLHQVANSLVLPQQYISGK